MTPDRMLISEKLTCRKHGKGGCEKQQGFGRQDTLADLQLGRMLTAKLLAWDKTRLSS